MTNKNIIALSLIVAVFSLAFASDESLFLLNENKNFTFILQYDNGTQVYNSSCINTIYTYNYTELISQVMSFSDFYYYVEYNNTIWNDNAGTYISKTNCSEYGDFGIFYYDIYVQSNTTEGWFSLIHSSILNGFNSLQTQINKTGEYVIDMWMDIECFTLGIPIISQLDFYHHAEACINRTEELLAASNPFNQTELFNEKEDFYFIVNKYESGEYMENVNTENLSGQIRARTTIAKDLFVLWLKIAMYGLKEIW